MKNSSKERRHFIPRKSPVALGVGLLISLGGLCALATGKAFAIELETGNPDVNIRWDNTVKYSAAVRTTGRSDTLVNNSSPVFAGTNLDLDDGDRNFGKGLISNRFDLLSEFDFKYKERFGFRISGAAWYDTVYNRSNDNNSPATANQSSVAFDQFPDATRKLMGRKAEFLDAFAYGNWQLGSMPVSARLGRHTSLYGETLFFGANGIANAQAPIDYIKLLSVPGSQFKEIVMPVNQLSGQVQLTDNVALGGYYQFEFRPSRLPPVGSYFNTVDVLGAGAENFLFAPNGAGVPMAPNRGEVKASRTGNFGAQVHWRPKEMDTDFGFYAAQYSDRVPQAILRMYPLLGAAGPMDFNLVYPERIKTFGLSASTTLGDFNVAAEASVRRNTPLVSGPQIEGLGALIPGYPMVAPGMGGTGSNALYAVGNSAHLNLSAVYLLKPGALWQGGSFLGEFAWNRRTSITKNAQALDPNTTRDASAIRFIFEPAWYQVVSQLDLSMPVSLGYNISGKSSVVQNFNGGARHGGDLSIGLKGTYQQKWRFALNYTHFLGKADPALGNTDTSPLPHLTFRQSLKDRNFVSLSVQTSF